MRGSDDLGDLGQPATKDIRYDHYLFVIHSTADKRVSQGDKGALRIDARRFGSDRCSAAGKIGRRDRVDTRVRITIACEKDRCVASTDRGPIRRQHARKHHRQKCEPDNHRSTDTNTVWQYAHLKPFTEIGADGEPITLFPANLGRNCLTQFPPQGRGHLDAAHFPHLCGYAVVLTQDLPAKRTHLKMFFYCQISRAAKRAIGKKGKI